MSFKGFHSKRAHDRVQRERRLGLNAAPASRTPLGKLDAAAAETARLVRVCAVATDLSDNLPLEVADLGLISMSAWDDVAPDAAAHALRGEGSTATARAVLKENDAQIHPAVVRTLLEQGFRVVDDDASAIRLLAKSGELRESHLYTYLPARKLIDAQAAQAATLRGEAAYTIRPDGAVVPGVKAGGRYFTVKEAGHAV